MRQAYNPYTGTRARSGRVNTAYGSAGRGAAYNPYTGTAARGGYRSSDYGTAAGVQTNRGTGAVAWDTNQGQGAVVKDRQGNVYAGKDGNVYKKGDGGSWSTNTGNGWQTENRPQPTRDLNSQSQARSRGNQLSQSSSQTRKPQRVQRRRSGWRRRPPEVKITGVPRGCQTCCNCKHGYKGIITMKIADMLVLSELFSASMTKRSFILIRNAYAGAMITLLLSRED